MKTTTAAQMTNAFAASTGRKVWAVVGKWNAGEVDRVLQSGLTYRQAKAVARAMREACGYANVERQA